MRGKRTLRLLVRGLGFLALSIVSFQSLVIAQSQAGRIDGRVTRDDGSSVAGVSVVLNQTLATALTSSTGKFSFAQCSSRNLLHHFHPGGKPLDEVGNSCVRGCDDHDRRDRQLGSWLQRNARCCRAVAQARTHRRSTGIRDAGFEAEIENRAAHGQLPKLLEFTPGAEVTQSGLYDFNFNTRGFNSSLNRRVATIIDGRNPSIPFLGAEEWSAVSFPLDDLASLEFVEVRAQLSTVRMPPAV